MNLSHQLAKHFREVYFGGNWTCSNVKENLQNLTWKQATKQVHTFNTIATLTYHMNYFVEAITRVLQGEPINAHDKYSFNHPPINSQDDWDQMVDKTLHNAEVLAELIEQLPEEKIGDTFEDEKYGIYYRNIHGLIEHTHYHLGQIALIKKLV
ncbi:MAG: DinB family protein [Crocinitomicaceae bacterium]|nr:DinB family protein [Crocinitomicaceae bacterium]